MIRSLLRRTRSDRGSSPVEFAIVATGMLTMTFLSIQAGLVFFAHSLALGAATQAVTVERGYLAPPGSGTAHGEQFLSTAGAGLTDAQVSVTRAGDGVTATVTGQAVSLLPGLTFAVSRTAHGTIEEVTAP